MSHFSHLTKSLCCWLREWPTASAQCWVAWSSARVVTSSTCRQTPAVEVSQVWPSTRAQSSLSKVCHRECVTSLRHSGFASRAFNLVTSRRNWSGTQLTWRQVFISVFFLQYVRDSWCIINFSGERGLRRKCKQPHSWPWWRGTRSRVRRIATASCRS